VVSYQAPLNTLNLQGTALTVVASGFLNPANNSNGPAFGLWVALPSGGALVELPLATSVEDNSLVSRMDAWPNPTNDVLNVALNSLRAAQADVRLVDVTGRTVLALPGTQLAAGENRLNMDLSALSEGLYLLSIAGEGAVRTLPVQVVR
jgi:hypothetical protein